MKVTTYTCDNCNKEITKVYEASLVWKIITDGKSSSDYFSSSEKELCEDCFNTMKRSLESNK